MSELTQEETRTFGEFCDALLTDPGSYTEISQHFTVIDPSFEYLFLSQRIRISAEISAKAMVKTVKEIKQELRVAQLNGQQKAEPVEYRNPFDNLMEARMAAPRRA